MRERELLLACKSNPYEKALLLMQMATFQTQNRNQAALLQEAMDCLVSAGNMEREWFAEAQYEGPSKPELPQVPRIMYRNSNSITLAHTNIELRKARKTANYEVYCKIYGAGIALSIGKVNSEYPGEAARRSLCDVIAALSFGLLA